MLHLLFALYLIFFCWLAVRIPFIKKTGLSPTWIIGLFLVKVGAAMAYGWFHTQLLHYETEADTWRFFFESKPQTQLLLRNPLGFFADTFANPYGRDYRHFFAAANSFWNDLKHVYMVKLMAIFNLFSGGHYYINTIFYSFLTFFGPVAFLRMMNDVFPGRLQLLTLSTFLFPSFLFWTAGIHKDGLIFLYISVLVYHFYYGLQQQRFPVYRALWVIAMLALIFPLRNHVVLAVLPGLAAWWLAERYLKQRVWIAFLLVTLAGTAVFFGSKYVHPKINLPVSIVLRNQEFLKLGGNSMLPQRPLEATLKSFVQNAPQALNHAMARPYLTENASALYVLCGLEIMLAWLLVFIWFFRFTENPYRHGVVYFLLFISLLLLLLTGYIVPQLGALVRYRSIYFPMILVPIIATIRWDGVVLKK
jgi:hypothetical protein